MDFATIYDIAKRVINHPKDYIGILQRHKLTLRSSVQESENIFSFFFSMDEPLIWRPGQHGIFQIPASLTNDNRRIFSIASIPNEKHIRISTVIKSNPSHFKTALQAMKIGQEIVMSGPIGEFHIRSQSQHIVGVAGGIGITPFRSLIKDVVDMKCESVKIELLYGCQSDTRTFQVELDEWNNVPNISIRYIEGVAELQNALLELAQTHKNQADYYLSGSPNMIVSLKQLLQRQEVSTIVNDPFKGY